MPFVTSPNLQVKRKCIDNDNDNKFSLYPLPPPSTHNLETENVKYGWNGKVKCDTNSFFIMDKRIMANKC